MDKVKQFYNLSFFSKRTRGILTMMGGLIIHSCMSLILIWGNMQPYVISYFRSFDHNITISFASLLVPCAGFFMGVSNLAAMKVANYFGLKLVTLTSITVYSMSLIVMSIMTNFNWVFVLMSITGLCYGFCMVTTLYAG